MSSADVLSIKELSEVLSPSVPNPHRPVLSIALLLGVDNLVLWLILRLSLGHQAILMGDAHGQLWPLLVLFQVFYWVCNIYPGISVSPVDDLRRLAAANTGAFFLVGLMLMLRGAPLHVQLMNVGACIVASGAIPALRTLVRRAGSRFSWWGYPIAIVGDGDVALALLRKLKRQPYLGMRPVALVSDRISSRQVDGVSVRGFEHLNWLVASGIRHAVVAAPELSQTEFAENLERTGDAFLHVIVIPDSDFVWKAGSHTCDMMGTLGLQVRNNLLRTQSRVAKRAIDLALCAIAAPFLLPLLVLLALAIAAESGFPVFYSQERLGHDGRAFRIWKFRTMARNAAEVLERILASDPALCKEWAENHKLRNDPRITKVGKVLRKTSLDELPQLWNVIRGEMSLVGPRPIVHAEVAKYKTAYSWYTKTIPGLTGLWQVSGRNHTTYAERVAYDAYYVRNWSVWMDIYLLAKTVIVILTGDGAY